ncbi:ATP-dependent nuclease [Myroides profundi]|uniref:ATP-dependent endonuclease of the OLD family n=1 Tax=Myroides profundi TaxID=480520 RepID=A0AAJ5BFB2_MYRPR|nr:AAA family ATPase [Myroides profundi]AJH15580.1 putative ATP-dependent endonuclease of the OLD family [Myroides profundi]SER52592.1 putative ATP-dependent endonuclease of the OLD family [Myroides profundi]
MYISKLRLWNFRKYGNASSINTIDFNAPVLEVPFKEGMNILIGENDSGKSAIIDAIKLVLKTHAYEWIKIEEEDFYCLANNIACKVRIEIEFEDIKPEEASNFIEWCGWNDKGEPKLVLIYQAELRDGRIIPSDVKAGMDGIGHALTYEAREFLKCTYLKALRDASSELTAKKNSRLSQILRAHKLFERKNVLSERHDFEEIFENARAEINGKFNKKGEERDYSIIKNAIDKYIQAFINDDISTDFNLGGSTITNILEKLSLGVLNQSNLGLGTMNRLFMAAELIHLEKTNWNGLRLCMIEELEAHLHPQAQLKIINRLKQESNIQFILSTHSPNITSQANLEDIILCKNNLVYPLSVGQTKLDKVNYKHLERFLDVTKSNLFFSKGNIIVEGWSEEIILPALAKKLGYDLTHKEISIINVASTAYLHFAKIFQRSKGECIQVPISIITDLDKREYEREEIIVKKESKEKRKEYNYIKQNIDYSKEIEKRKEGIKISTSSEVKIFISKQWTLEWCLLKSKALEGIYKTILKEVHHDIFNICDDNNENWEKALSRILLSNSINKTEIAYQLRAKLEELGGSLIISNNDTAFYLVEAIKHVCEYEDK